jgi:hypothetical protein
VESGLRTSHFLSLAQPSCHEFLLALCKWGTDVKYSAYVCRTDGPKDLHASLHVPNLRCTGMIKRDECREEDTHELRSASYVPVNRNCD